jgi:CheY-like chemotaxis protein/anti-sigma regulatory factor (Ser/Thr protein kinase)
MPVVLVVDDSEVDRRLVGGLLPQELDWLIEYAENGQQALEKMAESLPDVVITDMMMPVMDGMELVTNIHVDFPSVPVILITGHGNEALAVEALERGATSYVPKPQLSDKLVETVEQVLALSRSDRSYARLLECLENTHYTFQLDNDPALIAPLVDLIQQMLIGIRFCDSTERMHVGVALEEALLNALLHGNLELSKEDAHEARKLLRQGIVADCIRDRASASPYRERCTRVDVDLTFDAATFKICDQGPGFDISHVPRKRDPSRLGKDKGRGMVLVRNFMDEVEYNASGNEVTLIMRGIRQTTPSEE